MTPLFDSYSVWIYLQLVEKLKLRTVMTDEEDHLIQNAFENPKQFKRFESCSGLTQDLARPNLGDNNHADKFFLSDAEKKSDEKFLHLKTQITACGMRTKCSGKIDGMNTLYSLHTQLQFLQIAHAKNW